MLPKWLFYKNRKTIFSISWWHNSSMLPPKGLLWTSAAAQNRQMSSMMWLNTVKSSYRNHCSTKREKQFFRYRDGIIPAWCLHQIFHINLKNHCCACHIHNNLGMTHPQQLLWMSLAPHCCEWDIHNNKNCCGCHIHNNVEHGTFTTNCCECDIQKLLGQGGGSTQI